MIARPKVLIIDDDPDVRLVMRSALLGWHYAVSEVADGAQALGAIERERPALVVLDVGLPGKDGFQVLDEMRAAGHQQPVFFLTELDTVEARVRGLSAGADDYLGKPFSVEEFGARARALLRRIQHDRSRVLSLGDALVDLEAKKAERANTSLRLSARDFSLLEVLAAAHGRPVSREDLLQAVWGYGESVQTRTLETHLWRLRKKLGGTGERVPIRNVPGVGYVLVETPALIPPPPGMHAGG